MLTATKLIDDGARITTIFINQAFFYTACMYTPDMLRGQQKGNNTQSRNLSPSAFLTPSRTPTMVFQIDQVLRPHTASGTVTKSTSSFLSLVAKADYQFLGQAMKDQGVIYAGFGWVDAVLDQRETGLSDVEMSVVSESVSAFTRLHDLRDPRGSESGLRNVCRRFSI